MKATAISFSLLILIISFSCKDQKAEEPDLYGTWVKGPNIGDTLWFMKVNEKYIMRMPYFSDPLKSVYSDKEYQLINGILNVKSLSPLSEEYFRITSFKWIDHGKEFAIQNSQLFLFMSSVTTYKYKKS